MAVTLKMLSEQTGFSPATISRVLNNDPSMTVGEDTRRIIFDAAHRLGYSGSSGRRNQRTLTDTLFIGIAEMLSPAEQMTDPYFLYLKNFIDRRVMNTSCKPFRCVSSMANIKRCPPPVWTASLPSAILPTNRFNLCAASAAILRFWILPPTNCCMIPLFRISSWA